MQFSANQIASILNADIEGDSNVMVNRPSKIEEGSAGSISFLANPKYEDYIYSTKASIVVVSKDFVAKKAVSATLLRVDQVYESFASLLSFYDQAIQQRPEGISPLASVHPEATIEEGVAIGRFVTVEKGAHIKSGAVLFDQVYVGAYASIAENAVLHTGVKVLAQCKIGANNVLHANVVIGSDGFGFAPNEAGVYKKVPQVGNVILEADVEIGANSTVDRATMGSTIIRQGVKLDNLVQIGHNAEVGAHTVIAAQTGVAGSTKIGKHCRIGGQVGFVGHVSIADGTQIQAQSGIARGIDQANQAWFGSPAIPYKDYIRAYSIFKKLPDMYKQIYQLEQKLKALEEQA